jgi:hypothetical protein
LGSCVSTDGKEREGVAVGVVAIIIVLVVREGRKERNNYAREKESARSVGSRCREKEGRKDGIWASNICEQNKFDGTDICSPSVWVDINGDCVLMKTALHVYYAQLNTERNMDKYIYII